MPPWSLSWSGLKLTLPRPKALRSPYCCAPYGDDGPPPPPWLLLYPPWGGPSGGRPGPPALPPREGGGNPGPPGLPSMGGLRGMAETSSLSSFCSCGSMRATYCLYCGCSAHGLSDSQRTRRSLRCTRCWISDRSRTSFLRRYLCARGGARVSTVCAGTCEVDGSAWGTGNASPSQRFLYKGA